MKIFMTKLREFVKAQPLVRHILWLSMWAIPERTSWGTRLILHVGITILLVGSQTEKKKANERQEKGREPGGHQHCSLSALTPTCEETAYGPRHSCQAAPAPTVTARETLPEVTFGHANEESHAHTIHSHRSPPRVHLSPPLYDFCGSITEQLVST